MLVADSISHTNEKSDPFLDRFFSLAHQSFRFDGVALISTNAEEPVNGKDYLTSSQALLICLRVSTEENEDALAAVRLLASRTGE